MALIPYKGKLIQYKLTGEEGIMLEEVRLELYREMLDAREDDKEGFSMPTKKDALHHLLQCLLKMAGRKKSKTFSEFMKKEVAA